MTRLLAWRGWAPHPDGSGTVHPFLTPETLYGRRARDCLYCICRGVIPPTPKGMRTPEITTVFLGIAESSWREHSTDHAYRNGVDVGGVGGANQIFKDMF